jgi:hypothetical protein
MIRSIPAGGIIRLMRCSFVPSRELSAMSSIASIANVTFWTQRDPLDGKVKYRCIYEKEGAEVPFVLVNSPSSGDGRVILFSEKPDQPPVFHQRQ